MHHTCRTTGSDINPIKWDSKAEQDLDDFHFLGPGMHNENFEVQLTFKSVISEHEVILSVVVDYAQLTDFYCPKPFNTRRL